MRLPNSGIGLARLPAVAEALQIENISSFLFDRYVNIPAIEWSVTQKR